MSECPEVSCIKVLDPKNVLGTCCLSYRIGTGVIFGNEGDHVVYSSWIRNNPKTTKGGSEVEVKVFIKKTTRDPERQNSGGPEEQMLKTSEM